LGATEVVLRRGIGRLPFSHSDRGHVASRPRVTAKLATWAANTRRLAIMAMNHVNLMAIAGDNLKVLKRAGDGARIPYSALKQIVLIGSDQDHAKEVIMIVNAARGRGASFGTIVVTKGAGKSGPRGTLTVDNFRGNDAEKQLFIAEIRKISDRNVVFV
jgi:hypothetical protein